DVASRFDLDVSYGSPIDVRFDGSPRYDQGKALSSFVSMFGLHDFYGGILRARGGWGKTVWAALLIAEMKRTTMVVTHGGYLIDQWEERLSR
ncbi:MAG: hypothetical protein GTN93_11280, partial [Anaerolineae bacterium]|nr:hypothetical protein [Anaerolineae bacterium]